jgi:predicted DNA-binding protein
MYNYGMVRFQIYLTPAQYRELTKLSERTMAPVAAHVRKAIEEYLKRQK